MNPDQLARPPVTCFICLARGFFFVLDASKIALWFCFEHGQGLNRTVVRADLIDIEHLFQKPSGLARERPISGSYFYLAQRHVAAKADRIALDFVKGLGELHRHRARRKRTAYLWEAWKAKRKPLSVRRGAIVRQTG